MIACNCDSYVVFGILLGMSLTALGAFLGVLAANHR